MGKLLLIVVIVALSIVGILYIFKNTLTSKIISPLAKEKQEIFRPLEKYSFEALRKTSIARGKIEIGEVVKEEDGFVSRVFYFYDSFDNKRKKVSGLINLPVQKDGNSTVFPIIIMNRGFVEREKFTTGEGTRRTGEEFAKNGFITLAPDFLGYGESDMPSVNAMEERFQTYTTDLSLLASLPSLDTALAKSGLSQKADTEKVGLWGHSNGGHITLAVLAITGKSYSTVLWAPVSKSFPYSILYYTDEYDDHGKALRKLTADFEKDYDAEKYSVTNYFKWVKAPIQLHQGIDDEAVPYRWSDLLSQTLKDDDVAISYFTYPGENHNFNNGSWSQAVARSVVFYNETFSSASSPSVSE
ncbi:MAG: prolyl oligopeptidase family serine peptidase [bacterium]|nr:prolyl oligopeptidase family serine peptidase [bacterium]